MWQTILASVSLVLLCAVLCLAYPLFGIGDMPWIGVPIEGSKIYPLAVWTFLSEGHIIMRKGYEKYSKSGGIFKSLMLGRGWQVFVCNKELVSEIRRAPLEQLSFAAASHEWIQVRHTLDPNVVTNQYHLRICKNQLTKNVPSFLPDIVDEIQSAFGEILPGAPSTSTSEWQTVGAIEALEQLTVRVTNRPLIGKDLCRDKEYIKCMSSLPPLMFVGGTIMSLFPDILRPLVMHLGTNIPATRDPLKKKLLKLVEQRFQEEAEYGRDYLPNDMITWMMDEAEGEDRTPEKIACRILLLNLPTVHTIAITFAMILFNLAAYPEYVQEMREEAESILVDGSFGWSKEAFSNCVKLDSFIKEVLRLYATSGTSINRRVSKPFTFSNGVTLPAGTFVSCTSEALHTDESIWGDRADDFNGFRFVPQSDGEEPIDSIKTGKASMVSTTETYLAFGHGKNPCPGRYFSSYVMKAMLAHTILAYDVKFPDGVDGKRIAREEGSVWMNGEHRLCNRDVQLMFRKRC